MGRRDRPQHESKKPRKDAIKPIVAPTSILPPPPAVEVLGKRKKKRDEFPEEEEK